MDFIVCSLSPNNATLSSDIWTDREDTQFIKRIFNKSFNRHNIVGIGFFNFDQSCLNSWINHLNQIYFWYSEAVFSKNNQWSYLKIKFTYVHARGCDIVISTYSSTITSKKVSGEWGAQISQRKAEQHKIALMNPLRTFRSWGDTQLAEPLLCKFGDLIPVPRTHGKHRTYTCNPCHGKVAIVQSLGLKFTNV